MIHVVARSDKHGEAFLESHSHLRSRIVVKTGQRSYFSLLQELIDACPEDYACVVHDDVFLSGDFGVRVDELIAELNASWPNWGLVGNAAVLSVKVGYAGTNVVRYLSDPHGGPNLASEILPAQSIDGNVMLLNVKAMRARQLRLPTFDGFQLYDIILSIETVRAGLGVYVAPQLACWHGSRGNQGEFDRAKDSEAFKHYLTSAVQNRRIQTLNGVTEARFDLASRMMRGRVELELDSLRQAVSGRPVKTVAIVTRTQFSRLDLLNRTLDTIDAFVASAGASTSFRSFIVTDRKNAAPEDVKRRTVVLEADLPHGSDTRYQLVRFAAENIDADYFWFVDDDDWLFPNEAERLSLAISAAPSGAMVFLDCQHFSEKPVAPGTGSDVHLYRSVEGHFFSSQRFLLSLSGQNHSPFCGVVFERGALLAIPPRVYETVTYYEDFMTILNTLLSLKCFPVVVDKLYVGISLRNSGNTVTEMDRTKWDRSMSEMVSHLLNSPGTSQMLSLPSHAISIAPQQQRLLAEKVHLEQELAQVRHLIDRISKSKSWQLTRPLRVAARMLRGQVRLRAILNGLR
ncbi:glycosyltransferase family A protein [Paraburkholderia sp. FT54]|uniref:glycosyltransferase family A protein n=1 Tax=Paraburkholderia sp. FT54 TaxID=3074437 RepID=UPI002877512F|nr:glycosyltransferase family A protein [Paraburkholderia sp. FT54]WNC89264.1 glycosyltransferase family A protein [Paraburkholderia sp. FT54]